jgi:preprotein translocase subunit SecG
MDILTLLLVILLFIVAILLVLIVLVQDDQGDAMGGLFGGSSSSAFGSRSGNILTRTTSILGTLFVAIVLGMVFLFNSPVTEITSDVEINAPTPREEQQESSEDENSLPLPDADSEVGSTESNEESNN